ncbi:unnamed protein product [Urochloa humidicola]
MLGCSAFSVRPSRRLRSRGRRAPRSWCRSSVAEPRRERRAASCAVLTACIQGGERRKEKQGQASSISTSLHLPVVFRLQSR